MTKYLREMQNFFSCSVSIKKCSEASPRYFEYSILATSNFRASVSNIFSLASTNSQHSTEIYLITSLGINWRQKFNLMS